MVYFVWWFTRPVVLDGRPRAMFGFLNVDKPRDVTSRHVVTEIQRLVRPAKIGHAGTLDPLASGVLVVAVGPATRLVDYVHRLPKSYDATFLLGRQSDTEDITGKVVELEHPPRPSRADIEAAVPALLGEVWQHPPAFSALKIQGKRAYDLARSGQSVHLPARRIQIHKLSTVAYEYPTLRLDIECGSGTYVRSVGRDLAHALGTGAVMSALTRTAIGCFALHEACGLRELDAVSVLQRLRVPQVVFSHLEFIHLSDDEVRRVRQGQSLERPDHGQVGEVPALDTAGQLAAVLVPVSANQLRPVLTFPQDR